MPLDGTDIGMNRPQKRIEGHVADVLVAVQQESTENVDCQHSEATFGSGDGKESEFI